MIWESLVQYLRPTFPEKLPVASHVFIDPTQTARAGRQ